MNPLLEKTKQAVMNKADKRIHPVIMKLVNAGKQVIYSEKTRELSLKQIGDGKDPEMVGAAIAKLIGVLYNQSKKTAPMQAMIPAAVILLCEVLQFLEDAGSIKVDSNLLASYTQSMASSVLQVFGVTPDKLQGMMDKQRASSPAIGTPPAPAGGPPAGGILAQTGAM